MEKQGQILQRHIGVLIDDLVTKENHEPYRMMTSRAEYRLLLRQDNADLRLRKKGYQVGLVSEEDYQKLLTKEREIKAEIERLEHTNIGNTEPVQKLLLDRVLSDGWKSLSAKETGRIGGLMTKRKKRN